MLTLRPPGIPRRSHGSAGGGSGRESRSVVDGAKPLVLSRIKLRTLSRTIPLGVFALAALVSPHLMADRKNERRIAIYNIHNKETIDIVYMRDGKRIPEAMEKINWFMRDWRRNEATKMDPELIDILWELKTELGLNEPIHLISGFRSSKTNNMLRETRGGQASKSRHILGMAADVHFPGVPLKKLRYSALIRQKGGVGYYPTSGIPFVHVDTGNVRHWPRMPRYELALLFPNGQSQHVPSDGKPISKADVQVARVKHSDLSTQIAEFHQFRAQPKAPVPTLVADGWRADVKAQRVAAKADAAAAPYRVASLGPITPPAPRLAERPSRLSGPDDADRKQLAELVAQASMNPLMGLFSAGKGEAQGATKATVTAPGEGALRQASFTREAPERSEKAALREAVDRAERAADSRFGWGNGWVSAPAYDEEHPDELFYRPFPLAPMLTASASPDDPVLVSMQHPDVAATLEFVDNEINALPMRFSPGNQLAALLWTQQFTPAGGGQIAGQAREGGSSGIESRRVQTSMR